MLVYAGQDCLTESNSEITDTWLTRLERHERTLLCCSNDVVMPCYILTELYPSGMVCWDSYIVLHDEYRIMRTIGTLNRLITRPINVSLFLFGLQAHLITVDVTFKYPNIICLIDVSNTSRYAYVTITIIR